MSLILMHIQYLKSCCASEIGDTQFYLSAQSITRKFYLERQYQNTRTIVVE